jgi:DNA-binding HxlR family transcriptional regulator/putative sterol carrier protein
MAAAMDVVGERWTLLIVRELLLGPRRYNELLDDPPGIGTNLLADRLKTLNELGVIRQRPARAEGKAKVYELTPLGEQLRGPVLMLARWGMTFLGEPAPGAVTRPRWGFLAVQALVDNSKVGDAEEEYEFRVDGEVFHLKARDGQAVAMTGPAQRPAIVATTDTAMFIQIGSKQLTPFEAVASGRLTLTGDPAAVMRCSAILGLVPDSIAVPA